MSALLAYDHSLSLRKNVNRLKERGIYTSRLGALAGIGKNAVNAYIRYGFRTISGNTTGATELLRREVGKFFTDFPEDFGKPEAKADLFEAYGCAKCRYRMRSQAGCFKFGLTKKEINAHPWVNTLHHGAFTMTKTARCPHAT